MTNYRSVAAKVAQQKASRPDLYCPTPRCLWRTGDGSSCPRHGGTQKLTDTERSFADRTVAAIEKAAR